MTASVCFFFFYIKVLKKNLQWKKKSFNRDGDKKTDCVYTVYAKKKMRGFQLNDTQPSFPQLSYRHQKGSFFYLSEPNSPKDHGTTT